MLLKLDQRLFMGLNEATKTVAQQYRLLKVLGKGKPALDLSSRIVLLHPTNLRAAELWEQTAGGFYKPVPPSLLAGWQITEIQYILTAINGEVCGSEMFRHPVKHKLIPSASSIGRAAPINLFMTMALNDILDTDKFPGVKGLQFIC